MARGINKVILVGNLGANPDVAHMPNGRPVANIRLATSEAWKDRQTGETQQRTEWHSVVLFDKLADVRRGREAEEPIDGEPCGAAKAHPASNAGVGGLRETGVRWPSFRHLTLNEFAEVPI